MQALEQSHEYHGLYHVLHGVLSPLDGIGPEQLKIKELLNRLADDTVKEVIIATDPNTEGEATAYYLSRLIKPLSVRVTQSTRFYISFLFSTAPANVMLSAYPTSPPAGRPRAIRVTRTESGLIRRDR